MEKLEAKRGWNTGMGGWGKRKKRSTKDSTIEDEANNTTGQRITRNGRKYILLTPAQIRCTVDFLKVYYSFFPFFFYFSISVLLAKTKRTKGWLTLRGMWG